MNWSNSVSGSWPQYEVTKWQWITEPLNRPTWPAAHKKVKGHIITKAALSFWLLGNIFTLAGKVLLKDDSGMEYKQTSASEDDVSSISRKWWMEIKKCSVRDYTRGTTSTPFTQISSLRHDL